MKQFLFEQHTLTIICEGSNITVNLTEDERIKLIKALQSDNPQRKTARQWFSELPEPYKTQAIENCTDYETIYFKLSSAIHGSFVWNNTEQGHDYWQNVYESLLYVS